MKQINCVKFQNYFIKEIINNNIKSLGLQSTRHVLLSKYKYFMLFFKF